MSRRPGVVYLICFAKTPYRHAGHYLGFAYPDEQPGPAVAAWRDAIMAAARPGRAGNRGPRLTPGRVAGLASRLAAHKAGHGARLTAVLAAEGIEWRLVRIWPGMTEANEKWAKDLNSRRRLCPECSPAANAAPVLGAKRFRRRRPRPSPAMRKSPLSRVA